LCVPKIHQTASSAAHYWPQAALCGITAILIACAAAGCTSASASFGNRINFESADRRPVHPRMQESGEWAVIQLDVSGARGDKVWVQVYAVDEKGNEYFVGQEIAEPQWNSTHWDKFKIFVPLSRFAGLLSVTKINLYARASEDSDEYLGSTNYTLDKAWTPDFAWTWKEWADDAAMSGGGQGFHLKARLDAHGFKDKTFESVVVLYDSDGNVLKSPSGEFLVLTGGRLRCTCDFSYWDEVNFDVPYEKLSHLWPGLAVFARPGVRFEDGTYRLGNLYARFWAGGPLAAVQERMQADMAKLDEEISRLEKRQKALKESEP
jgi:hypothetical protein